MDVLLIIIVIVMAIIIFLVSFYLLTIYCHTQEKGIGTSVGSKIIIVIGLGLAWSQLLLIPLDVSNTIGNAGLNMELLYSIVYVLIFVYVTSIAPFTIFYYQSDEQDTFASRIGWSIFALFIVDLICYLLVFISYIWLSKYQYLSDGKTITFQLSIPLYMMLCLSLVGSFLLAIFGGVGLTALPIDLIQGYVKRPKVLKPQEARQKKKIIQNTSARLIQMGQKLKQQQQSLKNIDGWWAKRKQNNKVNQMFEQYKKQVIGLQESYDTFNLQLKISNVNPIVYIIQLILGSFCLILTIVWILQLIFDVIFQPNGVPIYPFLNNLFQVFINKNITFVATGFYGLFTIYLLWCVQKGNISFGLRIPFITSFHPMKKDETYLNSFLFNINLMLLASLGITQFSVYAFNIYTQSSYLGKQFQQIQHLPMFGWLYDKRFFGIMLGVVFGIYFLYTVVRLFIQSRKKDNQKD